MASTCQSATRRTKRTNKPSAWVASLADLRIVMNARFFKPTTRARTKLTPLFNARQSSGHHQFRNQYAAQLFRVDAQIHVLNERYTSQRPTRRALPLVHIELWVNCSGQTRQCTCAKRMFNARWYKNIVRTTDGVRPFAAIVCKSPVPHIPVF